MALAEILLQSSGINLKGQRATIVIVHARPGLRTAKSEGRITSIISTINVRSADDLDSKRLTVRDFNAEEFTPDDVLLCESVGSEGCHVVITP